MEYPSIIITTSHRPSDQARMLARLCNHIIPNSTYENRGSKNEQMVFDFALERNAKFLLLLQSKGNTVSRVLTYELNGVEIQQSDSYLKIYQFIDPKIYGWKDLPARGPLSISLEGRVLDVPLVDFMEKYLSLQIGKKSELWLMLDKSQDTTFMQFTDALTMKPFAFLKVALKQRVQKEVLS